MKKRIGWISLSLISLLILIFIITKREENSSNLLSLSSEPRLINIPGGESSNTREFYKWLMFRDPDTNKIPDDIGIKELEFARKLPKRSGVSGFSKSSGITQIEDWIQRGPDNVGGRTRALAIDVSDENIILAGGVSGGMWRSTDRGQSWEKTTTIDQYQTVTCIAQDTRPGKKHIWYYGTGEQLGSARYIGGGGIYKSIDGGRSWRYLSSTSPARDKGFGYRYCWNIVTDPTELGNDIVYAAFYSGIYRSEDGGESWNEVLKGISVLDNVDSRYSPYTDVAITKDGILYAAFGSSVYTEIGTDSAEGFYRSEDGKNWIKISDDINGIYSRTVIGVSDSNPDVVYFLSYSPGYGKNDHSLLKYTRFSDIDFHVESIWEDLSRAIPEEDGNKGIFNSQWGYDLMISINPDDENIIIIGGKSLWISKDGFSTTNNTSRIGGYLDKVKEPFSLLGMMFPGHHADQHSVVFLHSDPSTVFSAHDGGVSMTENIMASKVRWRNLNRGYVTTQFYSVAIDPSGYEDNKIIGGMQDNGTWFSNNNSSVWNELLYGDGCFCAIANNKTYYYLSTQTDAPIRYELDEAGKVLSRAYTRPAGLSSDNFLFRNPFILDSNDDRIMYLGSNEGIWRNSDLTEIPVFSEETSWEDSTDINWSNLSNTKLDGSYISALGISRIPENILYYSTIQRDLLDPVKSNIFRLNNANEGSPVPINISSGNDFPGNATVSSIAVDPTDGYKAVIAFSNYGVKSLWYTTDGGDTWDDVSGNLEEFTDGSGRGPRCTWIEIVSDGNKKMYFAATSIGLYSTTELNRTATVWQQEGSNSIGYSQVYMVDARPTDGLVVAATHGNGVFSANYGGFNRVIPENLILKQNYPNPFNPTTTIEFELPSSSDVKVTVYNILGQEVKTLLNTHRNPGEYHVVWDGKDNSGKAVASGTYIYRVKAGEYVKSKKMVLLR